MLCCSRSEVLSGVERRDALTLRFGLDEALWASQRFQEPGDGRGAKKKRRDNVRVARDAIASDARFSPPIDVLELVDATSVVVELGAGSGEWVAAKALSDPSTALLAVESRCDRAPILKAAACSTTLIIYRRPWSRRKRECTNQAAWPASTRTFRNRRRRRVLGRTCLICYLSKLSRARLSL